MGIDLSTLYNIYIDLEAVDVVARILEFSHKIMERLYCILVTVFAIVHVSTLRCIVRFHYYMRCSCYYVMYTYYYSISNVIAFIIISDAGGIILYIHIVIS